MTSRSAGFLTLLLAVLAACSKPTGFRLDEIEAATAPKVGLEGIGPFERRDVEIADERRAALVGPVAAWRWRGTVPPAAKLYLGVQILPEERKGIRALHLEVRALEGGERRILAHRRHETREGWLDLEIDLGSLAGRRITLEIEPQLGGPGAEIGPRHLAWSLAALAGNKPGRSELGGSESRVTKRPNVIFLLVDTLRADHLGAYGYERETSPEIDRLLGERGVVVEHAYAQAPWTVPSVAALMTSRYPGEILSGPLETYSIPESAETMAQFFAAEGYETAAFYANFTLRDANGFGRGFATRYTPPAVVESNDLHAETLNARALPWLRSRQHLERPFFLYAHYLDPHDPYDNTDIVDGRSPFYPDYPGTLSGRYVHGVYTGNIALADPPSDIAHLTALYDAEIRYVDRKIGELLSALDPAVARNTLIVLTADHGEELYDHGGWKHGQTLYQEQIHVPLFFRWDGRLPAGRRLGGTVELLDLLPTLAAAAGAPPREGWQGIDLLPALSGAKPAPQRPAFSQHMATGPLRAAVVAGEKKLLVFNREEPFVPKNRLVDYLWQFDLARLPPRELYDLAMDPWERSNRIEREPDAAAALQALLDHRLDRSLAGLKILAAGLPAGRRLDARIELDRPPSTWHPYLLSPEDRVSVEGSLVRLSLVGEPGLEKGIWLDDEPGLRGVEAVLDGQPLAAEAIRPGTGSAYAGGSIAASALTVAERPKPGTSTQPVLRLWVRRAGEQANGAIDPEVEKSLRALGYLE